MWLRLPRSLAWALALGALASACRSTPKTTGTAGPQSARAPAYPVTVVDHLGRKVTLRAEPKRIVSLLPSHTETLFALGVGDRVVGVDDFSDYPPEVAHLPRLGGLYAPHLEVILSLKPDLVLGSDDGNTAVALERAGLPVWAGAARSFDDVFRDVEHVGLMVGRTEQARALIERMRREVESIESAVRGRPGVTVYYELDSTPYSVGPQSFIGVLLTKAGGQNVIPAALGDFPKISPELVVAANPDVILGVPAELLSARPGWRNLEAAKDGRVFALTPEERKLIARPGPRVAKGLRALARRIHPEVPL